MKAHKRFNQYTSPMNPAQRAWREEAQAKILKLSDRPDAVKLRLT